MKTLSLYLILFLPLVSICQTTSPDTIRISKLVIDSKKTHYFKQGDSTVFVIIDTLIMKDKASLYFTAKKNISLTAHEATIGKNCILTANDTKNNGTNLNLNVNFEQLGSLYVDVSGFEARSGNRKFDNGNGGKVNLSFLSGGKNPQSADKNRPNYLSINNKAGGYTVNPQTDIAVLFQQMRNGAPGRFGGLPNGRVFSGNLGKDGTTSINPVTTFN